MTPRLLKALVPPAWRPGLRAAATRLRHAGLRYQCNICGAGLRGFLDYGRPSEPAFLCPVCRSKPPHRLASQWFDANPDCLRPGALFVHVAPEAGLGRSLAALAARAGAHYRAGGIADDGDSHLDILDLPFEESSVDLFFCCHVLNSLQEDRAAMREVRRVLKPGGIAILQVPAFYQGATTLETDGHEQRMAAFGDDGIFRCYTRADFEARLRDAGFDAEAYLADGLPAALVDRHQLKHEIMHVCRKRETKA